MNCEQCGQELTDRQARFCSRQCYHDWRYTPLVDKFLENVELQLDGCWLWIGGKTPNGYGEIYTRELGLWSVHRLVYHMWYGGIPDGAHVLHTCDRRNCCNPHHLYAGTHQDNMRDMQQRGRSPWQGVKGEDHPRSKLTWQEVKEIRARADAGEETCALAKDFDITPRYVNMLKNNEHRVNS